MANGIIQGAGNFFGDIVTAIQPGRTQQLQLERDKIESFLKSDKMRRKLMRVQKEAIEQGRTMTGATPRGRGGVSAEETFGEKAIALNKAITSFGEKPSPKAQEAIDFLTGKRDESLRKAKLARDAAKDVQDPIDVSLKAAGGRAALPRAEPKGGMTDRIAADIISPPPKDRRGLFSGADVTFDQIKPDLFQAPTPDFPESNVPPSFDDMGLTAKDDIAEFSKLEKGLPDVDLRSQYQANQQGFAKILQALKVGKTPDGKPFTIKDAIEFIIANQ